MKRPRKRAALAAIRRWLASDHSPAVVEGLLSRMTLAHDGDCGWAFWFTLDEEDDGYAEDDEHGDAFTNYVLLTVADDRDRVTLSGCNISEAVLRASGAHDLERPEALKAAPAAAPRKG